MASLTSMYPWVHPPFIASAPMRLISTAPLATSVTLANGFGFIAGGSDTSNLSSILSEAQTLLQDNGSTPIATASGTLPLGIGLLLWGASLPDFLHAIAPTPPPAAVWLFAPREARDLKTWADGIRDATAGATHIWVQVGSVAEAMDAVKFAQPEVLVVQGVDAGGHGLLRGAGIVSLVPEVCDALEAAGLRGEGKGPRVLAAGGIADGRGVAAALALGAEGVVLGTRYLASPEAYIKAGYRDEIVRASDGGQNTVRTKVYDFLRGTTDWPVQYGGRGVTNKSYDDWMGGMSIEENKKLYFQTAKDKGDEGWGPQGRMTTYAGTVVGIVKEVKSSKDITEEVRGDCRRILNELQP